MKTNWKIFSSRSFLFGQPAGDACAIGPEITREFFTWLSSLRGTAPIVLVFNNDGGEDDEARAIIDAIEHLPNAVVGVVLGRAESASAWILQCCDWRVMLPRSNLMFHMGSKSVDAHSEWADSMFIDDVLSRLREKDSTYPKNKLVRQLKHDWHVYSTQALALGLIDEIYSPSKK